MSYLKTAPEIKEMGDLAVVPVGSLEQHSRHLPVNTDILLAQAFADRVGEYMEGFVLPCLPISTCYEHKGAKGSVWMSADIFFTMLIDIIMNLKSQGFKRIVLIRGHGGIFIMDPVVRHLNANHAPDIKVCLIDPFFEVKKEIFETKAEVHSGEIETSVMLHLHPDLVKMERAVDFLPDVPRTYLQYGSIFSYSPEGVWGHPTKATKEKGRIYFEACVEECIAHAKRIFDLMKEREY